uniref:Uncharacterized protein n=1 Tax=Anguilla anguilla TaxID=7936 RepID=A0A0E9XV24_ANGAN
MEPLFPNCFLFKIENRKTLLTLGSAEEAGLELRRDEMPHTLFNYLFFFTPPSLCHYFILLLLENNLIMFLLLFFILFFLVSTAHLSQSQPTVTATEMAPAITLASFLLMFSCGPAFVFFVCCFKIRTLSLSGGLVSIIRDTEQLRDDGDWAHVLLKMVALETDWDVAESWTFSLLSPTHQRLVSAATLDVSGTLP